MGVLLKIVAWFLINLIPWFQRRDALKRRNTWREVKKHQWAVAIHTGVVLLAFLVASHFPIFRWFTSHASWENWPEYCSISGSSGGWGGANGRLRRRLCGWLKGRNPSGSVWRRKLNWRNG